MRIAMISVVLASCAGEPKLVIRPLPPLQEPKARTQAAEITVSELGLAVGEHWIWEVQARGFSIGRIELTVGEHEAESRFRTGALASAVANVEHDLVTLLDRVMARPQTSSERVDFAGKHRQFTTQFAGTTAHSFHTALGAIRAWARPRAPKGFLNVVHANQMFRLELEQPIVQQELVRIGGRVIGPDTDLVLTIWLDAARTPVRIEVRDGDDRVTAALISD
jgi:hypothetical protein